MEQQQQLEQIPNQEVYHSEAHPAEAHDNSYSQMPVANMLTPSTEQPPAPSLHAPEATYFQSASGLVLPQPNMTHISQHALSGGSDLVLPQGQPVYNNDPQPQVDPTLPEPVPHTSTPQIPSPNPNNRKPKGSVGGSRRSLPTGSTHGGMDQGHQPTQPTAASASAASWMGGHNQPTSTAPNTTISPTLAQQAVRNQRSRQSNQRMGTDSPQLGDGVVQPAVSQAATMQQVPQAQQPSTMAPVQGRTTSYQAPNHQRTNSRQSQRAQSRTPNSDSQQATGFRPPAAQHRATRDGNSRGQANDLVASTNYNQYRRYSGTNTASQSANRIPYEPYTQQQTTAPATTTYPAYDHGRSTSTTMSLANPTSMAPSYTGNVSTADQWSRSHSTRPYEKGTNHDGANTYAQSTSTQNAAAAPHNFDMRASAQNRRGPGGAMTKQQSQSYSPYTSQSQPHDHQLNQNQPSGWNYFGAPSNGNFSSNSNWL